MCPAKAPRRAWPRSTSFPRTRRRSGPSPKAIAAYAKAGEHLEDYPDGSASAIARGDRPRLRPRSGAHRLRFGLRRDPQPPRRRLPARRRRSDPHHAWFSRLSDRDPRLRSSSSCRAGEGLHGRCGRHARGGDANARRSYSSPIRTIRPAPTFPSTRSSACIAACGRTSCW